MSKHRWPGLAGCCHHIAGAEPIRLVDSAQDLASPRRQSLFEFPVDRQGRQREANTPGRLRVFGVSEPRQAHLLEDPPDALAKLLSEAEVGAHARDPRIAGEPGNVARLARIDEPGEPTRTLELDPIVEDLNPDVVAADAVGPVDDGVHETLEPGVLGKQGQPLEESGGEGPPGWQQVEDGLAGLGELPWDRALDEDVDLAGAAPSVYERAPRMFTIRPDEAEVLRAYVQWADSQSLFDGATVGIFWDARSEEAVDAFREAIAAAGHSIAVEVASDGEGVGSPQDQIAVERFIGGGVDSAVLLVGTSSVLNFTAFAESQNYRPAYRSMEWASQIGDVSSGSLPQEQYYGTLAMTVSRVGAVAADFPLSAETEACITNYERFSGQDIARSSPETAEWAQILYTCDLMSVVLTGLQGAGDDLSRESLVSALEGLKGLRLAAWGDLTYGPGDHAGTQQFRTIEWSADCLCWTARSDMVDFSG